MSNTKTLDDFLQLLSDSAASRDAINGLSAGEIVRYASREGFIFTEQQLVRQQTRAVLSVIRRGMEMKSMDSFYYRGIGGRLFYIACITPPGL
jgi:hypothetical protein